MATVSSEIVESLKQYGLNVGDYEDENVEEGLVSMIVIIFNVLVNTPGFMPDYPDIGLGLEVERHFLENDTAKINSLKTRGEAMLKKVLPNFTISLNMSVETDTTNGTKYLSILITEGTMGISIATKYISLSKIQIVGASYSAKNYNV